MNWGSRYYKVDQTGRIWMLRSPRNNAEILLRTSPCGYHLVFGASSLRCVVLSLAKAKALDLSGV